MKNIIKIEQPTEKSFGIVFSIIFLLTAIFFFKSNFIFYFFCLLFLLTLLITVSKPSILKKPNHLWFKFGLFLGKIVSPIVMLILYCLIMIPFGILANFFRKDPLERQFKKNVSTYWIKRDLDIGSFKNQF